MEGMLCDVRNAVRQIRAHPVFAAAVAGILAVAIGANAATFSLAKGLLLQPLGVVDAEGLVAVGRGVGAESREGVPRPVFSIVTPEELRRLEDARAFAGLAAYANSEVVWDGPDGLERVPATRVMPAFFSVLRTTPRLGRAFSERDAVEGANPVALLSHGAWTRRFGGAPDAVGGSVELNGERHAVVGVLPEGFAYPSRAVEVWVPLVLPAAVDGGPEAFVSLIAIGRLRPGVSAEQAAAEARTLLARGERRAPQAGESTVSVRPVREEMGRPFRASLTMLGAATGLVLLVACANVAGLLLVRGVFRRRELAVRAALGAGRGRIARGLLVESLLLSAAGGAGGAALAAGIVRAAAGAVPDYVPGLAGAAVDGPVLAFAAAAAVLTAVVFGTAPALAGSRVNLVRALGEGQGTATAGGGFGRLRTNRAQAALVVAQVAVALVLLGGAGLLLRSFLAFVTFDHGYDPGNIAVFTAVQPGAARAAPRADEGAVVENYAAARQFAGRLSAALERVERLPDIEAVALAHVSPIFPATAVEPIRVADRPGSAEPAEQLFAGVRTVSGGYADVLRLRLRAGRFFTDRGAAGGRRVVVVSEGFARRAFGGAPAVGRRLVRPGVAGDGAGTWEIVGVVGDLASVLAGAGLRNQIADIYVPILEPGMTQQYAVGRGGSLLVLVRSDRTPLTVLAFLREAYPDIHPAPGGSLDALLSAWAAPSASMRSASASSARWRCCSPHSASTGCWATRWRNAAGRSASAWRWAPAAATSSGWSPGRAAGWWPRVWSSACSPPRPRAGSWKHLLFDVTPADPLTLAAVTAALLAGAAPACWLPARRAARVDPMDALREPG